MEPAGLALSVFCTLKEVYLLSKFVIRVISSAIKHQTERARLYLQFRQEFLFLKSFGALLTKKNNRVLDDVQLNKDWLKHIGNILEQLRIAYGDYAKVAAAEDNEYKRFSPYCCADTQLSYSIDFDLDVEESSEKAWSMKGQIGRLSRLTDFISTLKQSDWKWALFQKQKLEDILADFKVWNQMLKELVPVTIAFSNSDAAHPSLYNGNTSEEDRMRLGLSLHARLHRLNAEGDDDDLTVRLQNFTLEAPEIPSNMPISFGVLLSTEDSREQVLIEHKPIVPESIPAIGAGTKQKQAVSNPNREAAKLASLLRLAKGSELRILPFMGYVERYDMDPPQYAFLFHYPADALEQSPISLHDLLSSESYELSLETRFSIAKKVATSLWILHADNWVHKSMQSQSIIFFLEPGGTVTFQDPYLVNFQYSRPANRVTTWTWDDDREKNLYRHPDRQGPPTKSFDKTHDAYALGVVLLEIGLLQTASKLRDAAQQLKGARSLQSFELRNTYVTRAKQQLPQMMGLAYRDAVLTCLMGDFDCKVHDKNFGIVFYEKVVQQLDIRRLLSSARNVGDRAR